MKVIWPFSLLTKKPVKTTGYQKYIIYDKDGYRAVSQQEFLEAMDNQNIADAYKVSDEELERMFYGIPKSH